MTRRLILAGAPTSATVDKTAASDLLNDFTTPIARFAGLDSLTESTAAAPSAASSLGETARWRSLPLKPHEHLPTGFSQIHYDVGLRQAGGESAVFFNTASLSFATSSEGDDPASQALLSQFYEHSRAAYDDVASSQVEGASSAATEADAEMPSTSEDASFGGPAEVTPGRPPAPALGGGASDRHLSDLEDLSSAAYLASVQPATVTVNLIVGIISVAPVRTVTTRWGARRLTEVLVGDESRAGFQITFWLDGAAPGRPAHKRNHDGDVKGGPGIQAHDLPAVLALVRPQDVVLLENVALNVFMHKVYGSSLRRRQTKMHLLYRTAADESDSLPAWYARSDLYGTRRGPAAAAAVHPQLEKTKTVANWVLDFVNADMARDTGVGARPPLDDTQ